MSLIHYNACPACDSIHIASKLNAIDYTVSQQTFAIWECADCTLRFTQDVPDENGIVAYYKSDNYISHSDTKKGVINSLYHLVRKRTLAGKCSLIEKHTGGSTGKLLDIGAGTGAFASFMQKKSWDVTALEPDEAARSGALRLYGLEEKPSAEIWKLTPGFHAITMWHVLEHVHELHGYLEQIASLLHEDGKAFIAVPNYTSHDATSYGPFWAAYDVPRHLYHFSPVAINGLLKKHRLRLYEAVPMWYDSFYVSMLSEQYKRGKPDHLSAVVSGLQSNVKAIADKEKCSSLIYIVGRAT